MCKLNVLAKMETRRLEGTTVEFVVGWASLVYGATFETSRTDLE